MQLSFTLDEHTSLHDMNYIVMMKLLVRLEWTGHIGLFHMPFCSMDHWAGFMKELLS